ncbi:MAG: VanZ family protein [Actinobacteria bacterium]|nr:VanZ family protein [Actinomycetota bacterium]
MLRQFGPSTWLAIALGSMLAILAFLPMVAARYRRAGRLRLIDLITLLAVAVYAVALWTYTLVPLPDANDFTCAGANLRPLEFLRDIRDAVREVGRAAWRHPAFLQAAFNVLLFIPLGYFLRVLARRGIIVATALGFAISATIEFTQRTGIWGLYPCAYRVFDVDDLILNTAGALIGSILGAPVAAMLRHTRTAPPVHRVTLGRRYVGMLADLMVMTGLSFGAVVGWRTIGLYLLGIEFEQLPELADQLLGFLPVLLLQTAWVLGRGRTVGEDIVQLEPVVMGGSVMRARLLKLLGGVGGYLLFTALPVTAPLATGFAVVTAVMAWRSAHHRGLSHLIAGMDLRVEQPEQ